MALMASSAAAPDAADVAPALPSHVWRAHQLASFQTSTIVTGHAALDRALPGGGWPTGSLTELLVQQHGSGEIHLLQPALKAIARTRTIALVQPPLPPQTEALYDGEFPVGHLMWLKTRRTADALWAAEQILKNGTVGALLFWQTHLRNASLRRLHLAAQASEIAFWLIRPLAAAQDASPAPLRLTLRPANGGTHIDIVKRRGPRHEGVLFVPLVHLPAAPYLPIESDHACVDQCDPAVAAARDLSPTLV